MILHMICSASATCCGFKTPSPPQNDPRRSTCRRPSGMLMGFDRDLMEIYSILIGCYTDFMEGYSDLKGFCSDLPGFTMRFTWIYNDLVGFYSDFIRMY